MEHLNKSLSELERWQWNDKFEEVPSSESSYLEKRFYELHNKKFKDFTTEDIDLFVNQQWGLEYVIPIAIKILEDNIFAEGDSYYKGELLQNVLDINPDYWSKHKDQHKKVKNLFISNQKAIDEFEFIEEVRNKILMVFKKFNKSL